MKRLVATVLFVVSACTAFQVQAKEPGFDLLCSYFEELGNLAKVKTLSNIQRNEFILDKLSKQLPPDDDARIAWEAIDSADAEMRYELFKSAAESVIGSTWNCTSMEQWASMTGEY